jgi:hypothetical protein
MHNNKYTDLPTFVNDTPMHHPRGPTILYTLENNKAVKMRIQCKKHFIINNKNNDTARPPSYSAL